jgi:hypothetical protein
MRKMIALALLFPALTLAQNSFDGNWRTRLDSVHVSGKPDVFVLMGGVYECQSCVPPYKVKADGSDQSVAAADYRDQAAVKVLSPSSIEITVKKAGKLTFKITDSVSADGAKLTADINNYLGAQPVTGTITEKRVADGPAGAHAISGSWMQDSVGNLSDVARILTLQSTPNGLKMTWNGQIADAKFDGKAYPTVGDPGNTLVTLKKLSDSQIEETDRRHGTVFDVIVWTVAHDGKTLTSVDTDPVHDLKTTMVYDKQP